MTAMDGKTKCSLRVALLPYLEEKTLYDAYNFTEPWDSPNNLKVHDAMPNAFRHPGQNAGVTTSSYYALIGKNTALIVGAKRAIPWTKPRDIEYSADKDVPALGAHEPTGYNILLCDDSVRYFSQKVDEKTLRAMITRNGNEVINSLAIPQADKTL
jgi:hypothetical protein